MKFKYIIIEKDGIEQPIIFSKLLEHNVFLAFGFANIVSAGFVQIMTHEVRHGVEGFRCYGKSTSLRIQSRRAIDEDIIMRNYCFEGV